MERRSGPVFVALAALVAALACGVESDAGDGPPRVGAQVDRPAPDYHAVSLEGDSVSLSQRKGKVVLLNVWATWCHPCRDEMPELSEIHTRYRDRGFEVIGVSVDGSGAERSVANFARELGVNFPLWLDPDDRVSARFMIVGVPTTFLIDRAGTLRWRKTGPIHRDDTALAAAIERAITE